MYSGRISEIGTVVEGGPRLTLRAPKTAAGLSEGGSVNINGACLSAVFVDKAAGVFAVEISAETSARSTLGQIHSAARVNLELPLRIGDPLDGHLVQGHTDAIGKVARIEEEHGSSRRVWIRPPKRFLDEIVAKGSVAVEGVSLTVAELLADRFSVALIPTTLRETTLAALQLEDKVNLESDLFVKAARDLWQSARMIATRALSALPWAGELTGPAGVEKCAAQLAAGGGVLIYDPRREAEADVVFAGATLRPESMVFLLNQVYGHTTIPCDRERLDRLEIPPMPGDGDRHGTAYHVSVDLAANPGTGVSAHDRAATVRRLAHPDSTPTDFLQPGHVFPLAARSGGLAVRRGHTEASLALCEVADGGGHSRGDGLRWAHAHRSGGRTIRPGVVSAAYLHRRIGAPPAKTTTPRSRSELPSISMKIGFALQVDVSTRADWLDRAHQIEESGFEALCVADHPGLTGSPFVSLAAAAQVTSRIRLATAVANVGVRDLLQLASDVATLDVLSDGRAVLGIGAGHTPAEWTSIGRRYPTASERVSRLGQAVGALRALLDDEPVTVSSQYLRLDKARLVRPRPIQSPLPILVGGNNRELVRCGAQSASIVELTGLGRTLEGGHFHKADWVEESIDERVDLVRAESTGRSRLPRLSALVQHVELTEDRIAASEKFLEQLPAPLQSPTMPPARGVSRVPFVMIGSASEIVDELLRRRERWGFTRYTVRWSDVAHLAPVMSRLEAMGELLI